MRKAERGNQVWVVDFVGDRTFEGKALRMLTVLDEYTREGLALEVGHSMGAGAVSKVLKRLIKERGAPGFVRSNNGTEFVASLVQNALKGLSVESAFIAPGSPCQNGKNERFNGTLSQEVLSREVWGNVLEAQTVCNEWLGVYNEVRSHGSLEMMTPAAYAQRARQTGVWYQPTHDTDSPFAWYSSSGLDRIEEVGFTGSHPRIVWAHDAVYGGHGDGVSTWRRAHARHTLLSTPRGCAMTPGARAPPLAQTEVFDRDAGARTLTSRRTSGGR